MGEKARRRGEVAALRLGLELGMTLIDTAEMCGSGGAEEVVGEAIAGRRDEVFIVSKVLPQHATRRGTPWCNDRNVPIMAYSPIDQARLAKHALVKRIADRNAVTPAQIALAWVLRQTNVIAIPKSSHRDHVRDNRAALDIRLSDNDLRELDRAFPPPTRKVPLEMT